MCVRLNTVTEMSRNSACNTSIAESVYLVLNSLWDCEPVDRLKQRSESCFTPLLKQTESDSPSQFVPAVSTTYPVGHAQYALPGTLTQVCEHCRRPSVHSSTSVNTLRTLINICQHIACTHQHNYVNTLRALIDLNTIDICQHIACTH